MDFEQFITYSYFTWYIFLLIPTNALLAFLLKVYEMSDNFLNIYNGKLYPDYWSISDELLGEENNKNLNNEEETKEQPLPPKYEDKYLDIIRHLNKEWEFNEEEQQDLPKLADDFLNNYIESKKEKIEEIIKEIIDIEKVIAEDVDDVEKQDYIQDMDDYLIQESTLEERNAERREKIKSLQEEYNKLKLEIETEDGLEKLKIKADKFANKEIINQRIEKLQNCYVMEKTPNGNVLMIYDNNRITFKYYADMNIPYRYLEVVARKYVKTYDCRPIFVDMEEELKLSEEKWEKEMELKKKKEEEDKKLAEEVSQGRAAEPKKNVFAKFKNYNKEAGGKISMAAPPKNSIPNKSISESKEEEKILLKEKANRYTYEGKFANFNFLQKVEKKVFNKKLGLSFADFKKIQKKV